MVMKEIDGSETDFFRFEEVGNKLAGIYKGFIPSEKYGKIYTFELENNKEFLVLGTMDLNRKMVKVSEGAFVSVEFVEEIPVKGGNRMKRFRVMVDDNGAEEELVK